MSFASPSSVTNRSSSTLGVRSDAQENHSALSKIQRLIDEDKFSEAVRNFSVHLQNLGGISDEDLIKTYQLVETLFSDYSELMQRSLEDDLQPLLNASRHMPEQQRDLAKLFGSFYETVDKPLLALHYYAKAAMIESHCPRIGNTAHPLASNLIIRLFFQHFKETYASAQQVGEKATAALKKNLTPLSRLCSNADDISSFYGVCGELYRAVESSQAGSSGTPIVQSYCNELANFRRMFSREIQDARRFQGELFKGAKNLFELFLKQAFYVLGQPPCNYDIRATGPLGREEHCPFSGFGLMILIEDEKQTPYFMKLAEILEFQIASLGETHALPLVFTALPEKLNRSGFHIEPRGNPAAHVSLIRTPEGMASMQKAQSASIDSMEYALLKSSSLYSNDAYLFEAYQEQLKNILDDPSRQSLARELLRKNLADFKDQWKVPSNSHHNLETQYVEMLDHFLTHFALYWGLESTNALDIIEEFRTEDVPLENKSKGVVEVFSSKDVFVLSSSQMLKEAVETLYRLRIRAHLHYGEGRGELVCSQASSQINSLSTAHCVVTREEQAELEKIHRLVLKPLYSRLATAIEKEYDFESVFKKLDLPLQAFIDCMSWLQIDSIPSYRPLIVCLASHLVATNAPLEEHELYYEQISRILEAEPLREAYIETVEASLPKEWVKHLERIPNPAGLQRAFIRGGRELLSSVLAITTEVPPPEHVPRVQVIHSSFRSGRYLKEEVVNQILTEEGDIRKHYKGSAHRVSAVIFETHRLHFKQKPTHALMEYANHDLYFRIGGDLTPSSNLFRFVVKIGNKEKFYPVLISQTFEGTTAKDNVHEQIEFPQPQWERLTSLRLCSILTRVGDGRFSNYLLSPQADISCVDNEISFVPPVINQTFSRQVNFCSALFCHFDPTRSLPRKTLKEFCELDPDAILNGWIQNVIEREQEYLTLFSEEERSRLYNEDPENRFKATILFKEGELATLNIQFHYMQDEIRRALRANRNLCTLDLLSFMIDVQDEETKNLIGPYIFRQYRSVLGIRDVESRLKAVTERAQDRSMLSVQTDKVSYGKTPTLQEVERLRLYGPEKARDELFSVLLKSVAEHAQIGSVRSKRVLAANFNHFTEVSRQKLVLEALIAKVKRGHEYPVTVILQNCAALYTKDLEELLHPGLEVLDLRGCRNIQDKDIVKVQERCPNLKELYLSGCLQIESLSEGWLFSSALEFSKLTKLHVEGCPMLKTIKIAAPLLKEIKAGHNGQLIEVEIAAIDLPERESFAECRRLVSAKIKLFKLMR